MRRFSLPTRCFSSLRYNQRDPFSTAPNSEALHGGPCDPLPLTVALLYRAWLQHQRRPVSPHAGALSTPALMAELYALWGGDPRARPASASFLRGYPALFSVAEASRAAASSSPTPAPVTPPLAALVPRALALACSCPPGGQRTEDLLKQGCWPPRAVALLRATPLAWLPTITNAPNPSVWGPILASLLEARGAGDARRLPVAELLAAAQEVAVERCLPLPPWSLQWFLLSPAPEFARLRPVWGSGGGGGRGGGRGEGKGKKTAVAVELAAGSVLEEDIAALSALAAGVRAREGGGAAPE